MGYRINKGLLSSVVHEMGLKGNVSHEGIQGVDVGITWITEFGFILDRLLPISKTVISTISRDMKD